MSNYCGSAKYLIIFAGLVAAKKGGECGAKFKPFLFAEPCILLQKVQQAYSDGAALVL